MIKRNFLLATIFSLSIFTMYAQQKPTSQKQFSKKAEKIEKRDSIWEQLNLTADQQDKINKIKTNAKSEATRIKKDSTLQPQEKKENLRAIITNAEKEVQKILTSQQKEQLKSLRLQQMIERTSKELGLTEDQKNKLIEAQKVFHERSMELQEKMKETRSEFSDKLKSFLSEEQFKQYMNKIKKMMETHHHPPIN